MSGHDNNSDTTATKLSDLSLDPSAKTFVSRAAAETSVPSGMPQPTQEDNTRAPSIAPSDIDFNASPPTAVVNKTSVKTSSTAPSHVLAPTPVTTPATAPPAPRSITPASKSASPMPSKKAAATAAADNGTEEDTVDQETLTEFFGKEHINVLFIGHVDAGKSTMGGRILEATGMIDKRTLEKIEREAREAGRESWYLSWALDTNVEERAKGKTVEVGRAYFETDTRRYTILDAPGHKAYVPNMIGGAAQADVAVLVISARKGEFETGFERGGQTREHAVLAKNSGVNKLVVVINKMDDPTVNWSKERYDECVEKLSPFLKSNRYNLKGDVVFMPVSGYTGANIKSKVDPKDCDWYSGPTLLERLDTIHMTDRKLNAPFRMPISEKYKDMGTIVVGKIEAGSIKKGAHVLMMPNAVKVEIAALFSEQEEEIPMAGVGDNVRLRLRGVEEDDIMTGFVLCSLKHPVHAVTKFEAALGVLDHKNIISAGYNAVLHVHTAIEEITLSAMVHLIDKKTGRKSKRPPQFLKKGQQGVVVIETGGLLCVETFADSPQMGRFALRDEGRTIAIGKITKLYGVESSAAEGQAGAA
ncbi:P-loop containing nucleoside triphosphate hydrolase protein [Gamsiella multidivaricata]|uniref:P-loop containing nucleoside triphosphate hydrolase protein n=1 Tax=Gamsiella multidivaricata TaxID=101098 RepID=UPI00221E77F9|nr:P-loop containing nucleoside triphosphate hydrolase protein [Gamsiella multidivaricata]KAG0361598.1 translation termination factor GTPase eRF3 [Gamsiella multidivaricata]KAI7818920.1 P-loop containing nucleoside triphosphate hydrolase protein [Gamsiella multidivaricata]